MELGLEGQHVIVTGGASNIGRAIAFAFAEEGAIVSILDKDVPQSRRTASEIEALGSTALAVAADVADPASIQRALAYAEERSGPVDVLVNNVGWNGRQDFFLGLDPDRWDKSYRLNLFSVFAMTHAVLPGMIEREAGAIVSISSDAAFGDWRVADYGAMKAGVLSFTRSIAKEYGRYGIRANAVTPGMVPPDPVSIGKDSMWVDDTGLGPEQMADIDRRTPLRRRTEARDIAWTTLFLASQCARQLTGQVISVSGGFQMPR